MKYLPLILGLACILGAIYQLHRSTHLLVSGRAADGVIIRNEKSTGRSTVYYPVARFTADDGRTYESKGHSGTYPAEYEINDRVPVHYDPAQPTNAYIGSFLGVVADTFLSVALGSLFVWFGLRIVRKKPFYTAPNPLHGNA